MSNRQAKIERLKAFTTFEDIFALALAHSVKQHFLAGSEPWCEAMFEVRERYSSQIPELKDIYFTERPPLAPQSDQVYQIFTTLARAGEISLPNPQLEEIVVRKSHKNRIRKAIGNSLSKYDAFMGDIVRILEEKVAVR